MPLKHKVGSTWHDVVVWHKVGTVWKKVALWNKVGTVWKQITTLFSANYPEYVTGSGSGFATSGNVNTGTGWTAPTYSGASGGAKTFVWTKLSGSAGTTRSSDIERPNFNHPNVSEFVTEVSVWQVTVTDAGNTATDTVTVSLNWANMV